MKINFTLALRSISVFLGISIWSPIFILFYIIAFCEIHYGSRLTPGFFSDTFRILCRMFNCAVLFEYTHRNNEDIPFDYYSRRVERLFTWPLNCETFSRVCVAPNLFCISFFESVSGTCVFRPGPHNLPNGTLNM